MISNTSYSFISQTLVTLHIHFPISHFMFIIQFIFQIHFEHTNLNTISVAHTNPYTTNTTNLTGKQISQN